MRRILIASLGVCLALTGLSNLAAGPPEGAPRPKGKSVEDWTLALLEANPKARVQAADALGEIGPGAAAAVPALVEALADRDVGVQLAVINALGRIGKAAVPRLTEALGSAQETVRENAADALSRIGP